jgi:DNA-binding transcriptional MocR family regulator
MTDDNASGGTTATVLDRELRDLVAGAAPGTRLPSVRALMARHRTSPVTVQRAIARLTEEGLVEPRPGRGTFVAGRPASAAAEAAPDLSWQALALGERATDSALLYEHLAVPRPDALALTVGYPDESLQPTGLLASALARAGRRPGAWARVPTEGLERLRAWFALQAGGRFRAHDVVVTPGAQAGLATALRVLAAPGAPVLLESPGYLGAIAASRAAGHRIVPVPSDADGIRPDHLAAALRATGARLVVVQPLYANPHGAVLAPDRRAAVLAAVREAGAFLIEDDYARDLAFDGSPPAPLAADDPDGHVVYLRTLTKSAAPGLRVGAICARGAAGVRLRSARVVDDFFVAGPLQEAALDLVSSPAWRRHRRTVAAVLRERRDVLVGAIGRHLPDARVALVPRGGFTLWVALPDDLDDAAVARAAAREGVVVGPGRAWFPAEPPGPFLRLAFAGAPAEDLERGVAVLGRVAADLRAGG